MILIAVYVCTLAIHGATVRLMFSMGRDRRLPLGGLWGHVNHTLRTPANAGIMVAILAAIPFVVTGAGSAIYIAIAATGMIYIAYFLCNFGVLIARRRGWPHQGAWFNLGSWGTILNIFALVWGGFMVINIAIWTDPGLFGVFGNDLRNTWSNPFINTFIKVGGTLQDQLPAWPIFETVVGIVLGVGALYYVVAQRGKSDATQVEAGRRDRRSRHRLGDRRGPARRAVRHARRGARPAPRAGRARPHADRPLGRDHEPELPGRRERHGRSLGRAPRGQRHAPARHQPGGRARRDGRGGGRRAWVPR